MISLLIYVAFGLAYPQSSQEFVCIGTEGKEPSDCQNMTILSWDQFVSTLPTYTSPSIIVRVFDSIDITSQIQTSSKDQAIFLGFSKNSDGAIPRITGTLELTRTDQFFMIDAEVCDSTEDLTIKAHYSGYNESLENYDSSFTNTPIYIFSPINQLEIYYDFPLYFSPICSSVQPFPKLKLSASIGDIDNSYTFVEDNNYFQLFMNYKSEDKVICFSNTPDGIDPSCTVMTWNEALNYINDETKTFSFVTLAFYDSCDISGIINGNNIASGLGFLSETNNITGQSGRIRGNLEIRAPDRIVTVVPFPEFQTNSNYEFASELSLTIHSTGKPLNSVSEYKSRALFFCKMRSLHIIYTEDVLKYDYSFGYSLVNVERASIPVTVQSPNNCVNPFNVNASNFNLEDEGFVLSVYSFPVNKNTEKQSFCIGSSLNNVPSSCNGTMTLGWNDFIEFSKGINSRRIDIYFIEPVNCYGQIKANVSNIVFHNIGDGHASGDIIVDHIDTFIYASKGSDENPNYMQNVHLYSKVSGENVKADTDITFIDSRGYSILTETNIQSIYLEIDANKGKNKNEYQGYVTGSNSFVSQSYISSSKFDLSGYITKFSPSSTSIQYHVFSKPSNSSLEKVDLVLALVGIILAVIALGFIIYTFIRYRGRKIEISHSSIL